MKVFLSWSGERSRLVATAIRDWLPQVINAVEPFLSSDIDAGARWQSEVAAELEETDFGILCVTAENQQAPWLNFEAGALAKKVGQSRVVPLAIDLRPAEILLPLAQFQGQSLTRAGMSKIISTINSGLTKPLHSEHLEKSIEMWWSELDNEIIDIDQQLSLEEFEVSPGSQYDTKKIRSDRELIEDILTTVRSLARSASPESQSAYTESGNRFYVEARNVFLGLSPEDSTLKRLLWDPSAQQADLIEPSPVLDKSSGEVP